MLPPKLYDNNGYTCSGDSAIDNNANPASDNASTLADDKASVNTSKAGSKSMTWYCNQ